MSSSPLVFSPAMSNVRCDSTSQASWPSMVVFSFTCHVAVDGIVAIELAENAFHDDLGALLRGEESIAGLQLTDEN